MKPLMIKYCLNLIFYGSNFLLIYKKVCHFRDKYYEIGKIFFFQFNLQTNMDDNMHPYS